MFVHQAGPLYVLTAVKNLEAQLDRCQDGSMATFALVDRLVSRMEIAELLGVTRQRVHQLIAKPDFPAPVATLSVGMIWRREDVEEWARRTGRLPEG